MATLSGTRLSPGGAARRGAPRWFAWVLAVGLGASLVTGCSDESAPASPSVGGPYAGDFAEAITRAPNDFVRSILSDGAITLAELQEALGKTVECIASSGMGIETIDWFDPLFGYSGVATSVLSEAQEQVVWDCEMQWSSEIEVLYRQIVSNPDNSDMNDLVAACLVRHGLVAPGFTGADYVEVQERHAEQIPASGMASPFIRMTMAI